MDLNYSPQYEEFRLEVREFLAENWARPAGLDRDARAAVEKAFRNKAIQAGYLYRNVPREYGGSGQEPDVLRAQIIREEFRQARAPVELHQNGVQLLVPTLLEHGQPWQKEAFIPKTIAGEYFWAQGYSEPGSGSDLASVRTRGEIVGDEWVINGQKIWSTGAQYCQYMFALIRTEPDKPKHEGISYLLIDLRQPGISVRPLKQITGRAEFCEVFFNDARTPSNWIVGQRGEGWKVSRSTLKFERSYIGGAERSTELFARLMELCRSARIDGEPALRNPAVRQRVAEISGALAAQRYSSYRQISMAANSEDAGIVNLMFKVFSTDIGQDIAKLARDLIQESFLLAPPDESNWRHAGFERWNNQFMGSLGLAIAGGTSNIQRNIIAERGLGLGREKKAGGEKA